MLDALEREMKELDEHLVVEKHRPTERESWLYASGAVRPEDMRAIRDTKTNTVLGLVDVNKRKYYDFESVVGIYAIAGRDLELGAKLFSHFTDQGWNVYCK